MPEVRAQDGFRHIALFYQGSAEYRAALSGFVQAAVTSRDPVLFVVPAADSIAGWLDPGSGLITLTDMEELGRNPGRVIPALRTFADMHHEQRVRILSEFIWPGRPAAEMCEAARHEALMESALAGIEGIMVCPYDTTRLPPPVLSDAACTHRWQQISGAVVLSETYSGPDAIPDACTVPLPRPPADARTLEYRTDLRPVRDMVTAAGRRAGLPGSRVTDLTLAVSELAANTLQHTRQSGVAQAWQSDGEIVCQVTDSGYIHDPLAGLSRRSLDQPGGKGLWLVHQVCDLVEIRTAPSGTMVRVHMRLPGPAHRAG